jgi:hypothetical protein
MSCDHHLPRPRLLRAFSLPPHLLPRLNVILSFGRLPLPRRLECRLLPLCHRAYAGAALFDQRADRRHAFARWHAAPGRLDLGRIERDDRRAFAARGEGGSRYAACSIGAVS